MVIRKSLVVSMLLLTFCLSGRTAARGIRACSPEADTSSLARTFLSPPQAAKPQVWWHWMDGNVSKEGIRKDLEWMKRIGLGGFHQFDAGGVNMPRAAKVRLPYLSEGWKDAFRYALSLADSLGFEVTVASAPGWSSTGGTWVRPEDAIKKLEWRSVDTRGGKISMTLPALYRVVGPYQDYATFNDRIEVEPYGRDLFVLAVRLPNADRSMNAMGAEVQESDNVITCTFRKPQTIKALTLKTMAMASRPRSGEAECRNILECSNDGVTWRKVCGILPALLPYTTVDIPPTTATHFRVRGEKLISLDLFTVTKVDHVQELGGFVNTVDFKKFHTPYSKDAVRVSDVVDLTGKMSADGKLDCVLPAGRWRIYRFGWSITGKINHPASPDATGLEVDKLDPDAWMRYFRTYVDLYKEAAGGMLGGRGIRYLLTDSYEAGSYTWTPKLLEEFSRRRGYSPLPWLPVLAGEVIGSSASSERFLWDWRRTLGELFCENYDRINDIVKEYGLAGRYAESHEGGRAYVGDGMDPKITSTVPMAAIWMENTPTGSSVASAVCDIRESASVSHIYGQNIVAGESFSVNGDEGRAYTYCPENMKYVADVAMSAGLNRFVIHESASQPNDSYLPGLQLFRYGQWFHRNETWGEYAWVLTGYLARSSSMLQQGRAVADILLYYGEDFNITSLYGGGTFSTLPQVPDGYEYDFANPTVLLSGVRPENGRLTSGSGASYRVLWMDRNCETMSLEILRRIKDFADAGVVICGSEPKRCAGLLADDRTFSAIVDDIWHTGRKNVFACSLQRCLSLCGIAPDFEAVRLSESPATGAGVPADGYGTFRHVHRQLSDGTQVYWVRNFTGKDCVARLSFRDGGKCVSVFNPEDGSVSEAEAVREGERTTVTVRMISSDARFIVFSDKPQISVQEPADPALQQIGTVPSDTVSTDTVPSESIEESSVAVGGVWKVHFAQKNGGTADEEFTKLVSWTEKENPVVKYFSGTAVYRTSFTLDSLQVAGARGARLDLGSVKNIADISVNGTPAGVLWKAPFVTGDIRGLLRAGENVLEIKVTNLWRNRMIGDVQPGEKHQVTSIRRFYKADAPLIPSGLLGPVRLVVRNVRNQYSSCIPSTQSIESGLPVK